MMTRPKVADSPRKPWTRDELILAINLYCKTPFGRIHVRNPDIIQLAGRLGRTPGSVSYKLANFAAIDPSLDRVGAPNFSKLDQEVWNEFFVDWDGMAFASEQAAEGPRDQVQDFVIPEHLPAGMNRQAVVRVRVNQSFFRKMVLAAYDGRCCITGLPLPELLVASHIIPWAADPANRMNPRNGLCLNALHDRAFDTGLIAIDDTCRVMLSPRVRRLESDDAHLLRDFEGRRITLPRRFVPDQALLARHRREVFG